MWFILLLLGALLAHPIVAQSPSAALSVLGVSPPANETVVVGNPWYTCQILEGVFPKNETFIASSPYYSPLVDESWSENCRLNATCIVTPESAQDVSLILQILSVLRTKFAIRSGGHNINPGFSSIGNNGVLIALEKLDTLSLSSDSKTVTVGPGNRWQDVYKFLEPYGLTALGGRTIVVGVGGYLLGGGLSTFYNTYGLAMDSITRYQVVLTNGSIVNATQTEHADLYKGLKGGLSNFGIVTEYDLTTNTGVDIYYEVALYNTTNTPAVLEAYANYLQDADVNSNVEIQINPGYTLVFYGYLGHVYAPTAFDAFTDIPVESTLFPPTNGSLNDVLFNIGSAGLSDTGISYGGTFSFRITDPSFLVDSYQVYLDVVASLPSGVELSYVPQGVIPNLVTQGRSQNGGNLLGLEATPQVWADIFAQWPASIGESSVTNIIDLVIANLTSQAQSQDLLLPFIYVNDAAPQQEPLLGYGTENLRYIETVAAKYDPQGVMQKLQNYGYFISEEL